MLTRRQYDLLMYVHERVRESGIPPSFEEMTDAMGLKSKSSIHRLMTSLEERGFIRRIEGRARCIEIMKLPANVNDDVRPAISQSQISNGRAPAAREKAAENCGATTLPLIGRIGISTPIESLQSKIADVVLDAAMIGRGEHYAVEMLGDSMINAGILDGDTLIVCETNRAMTGEIIIALTDEIICRIARYRQRGSSVVLEAANPAYHAHIYDPDRVKLQGKVVGLLRRY